jgi:hypothetical protein
MVNVKQYYVYQLVDPRNNKPFYIGKGQGKRIHNHEAEARRGIIHPKCSTIREIEVQGLNVIKEIVKEFAVEAEAYNYEMKLIKTIGLDNLTNLTHGGLSVFPYKIANVQALNSKKLISILAVIFKKTRGNLNNNFFTFGGVKHDLGNNLNIIVTKSLAKLIKQYEKEWICQEFKKYNVIMVID